MVLFKFKAFQFDDICQTVSLTLCPLMGKFGGIEPICYARNADIAGLLVFQPATLMMDIVALCMTSIMIINVKSKYTAVGRKEITMFFQLYLITILLETLLVTSVIPHASILYPVFTAAHISLLTTSFWCLFLNGFVGFQFAEDGTRLSLWVNIGVNLWSDFSTKFFCKFIRGSSIIVFLLVGFISLATFNNLGPFSNPGILWTFYYIVNGFMFIVYTLSQIGLVCLTLDDRWPLGDIVFGVIFFILGLVSQYIFSIELCEQMHHYMDGLFLGTTFNLLAVMMVYKYWDSITKEDLEFSIDSKHHQNWEIDAMLLE